MRSQRGEEDSCHPKVGVAYNEVKKLMINPNTRRNKEDRHDGHNDSHGH